MSRARTSHDCMEDLQQRRRLPKGHKYDINVYVLGRDTNMWLGACDVGLGTRRLEAGLKPQAPSRIPCLRLESVSVDAEPLDLVADDALGGVEQLGGLGAVA